jgi:hypothetical protein
LAEVRLDEEQILTETTVDWLEAEVEGEVGVSRTVNPPILVEKSYVPQCSLLRI